MIKFFRKAKYDLINIKSKIVFFFQKKKKMVNIGPYNTLFISNSYHGGTLRYESNYIKSNPDTLILKPVFNNSKFASCYDNSHFRILLLIDKANLDLLFHGIKIEKIVISSLLTYPDFDFISDYLIRYIKEFRIDAEYLVHDYHCICNNLNMVINNSYCKMICISKKCMYEYTPRLSERWIELLTIANRIKCFSYSSKNILLSRYPVLNDNSIDVVPHSMDYFKVESRVFKKNLKGKVAFVGQCDSVHKGINIINDFVEKYSDICEIILIGNIPLRKDLKSKNVILYGRYINNELLDILYSQGVNVILFPSVLPETFSYLISELILSGIPIVCFNIGAQCEKVRQYNNGFVAEEISAMSMFKVICDNGLL